MATPSPPRCCSSAMAWLRAGLRISDGVVGRITGDATRAPHRRTIAHPQWLLKWNNTHALRKAAHVVTGTVLDVGCGTKPWKHLFTQARKYIGTDYLGPSATSGAAQSVDVCADATALPFPDASVDWVVSTQCLEHVCDAARAVAEMYRLLRPGGHLVATTPFGYRVHDALHDYVRWTPQGLQALLRSAGFSSIKVQPIGGLYATLFTAGAVRAFYEMGAMTPGAGALHRATAGAWRAVVRPLCLPVFALGNALGVAFQKIGPWIAAPANTFPPSHIVVARKAGELNQNSHGRAAVPGRVGDLHPIPGDWSAGPGT